MSAIGAVPGFVPQSDRELISDRAAAAPVDWLLWV